MVVDVSDRSNVGLDRLAYAIFASCTIRIEFKISRYSGVEVDSSFFQVMRYCPGDTLEEIDRSNLTGSFE